jgi:hypothetical protein
VRLDRRRRTPADQLLRVEDSNAGMVWAPSAVWDESTSQFFVFWASRFYQKSDAEHKGKAGLDRIRYTTTRDFKSFSPAKDYLSYGGTALIDQEFQYLGQRGHWARFYKNETVNQVAQEMTTGGLFGQWKRVGSYISHGEQVEGPASFADNTRPGVYHVLLDNYKEYVPYSTSNINSGSWQRSNFPRFTRGLKHGSVTPLLQSEYDAVRRRFGQ